MIFQASSEAAGESTVAFPPDGELVIEGALGQGIFALHVHRYHRRRSFLW